MKIKPFLYSAIIAVSVSTVYAQDSFEIGSLSVGGKLQFDYFDHRLGEGWVSSESGYKGINYNYDHRPSSSTTNNWTTDSGQLLFLDVDYKPTDHLSGSFKFEFLNNYANRYWMPVNLEHRLMLDDKKFFWSAGDITYKRSWWNARYYRGVGHFNWNDEGDLFNLYPEQNDVARYQRVSGRAIPEAYELNMNGSAGQLELIYGPEALWDYKKGYYANYNFFLGGLNSHLIYRDHIIPFGETDERMRATEFSTSYDIGSQTLQLGLMYQPFRLNRTYEYVEDVAPGTGEAGSSYIRKTGTTGTVDAIGGSIRAIFRPTSLLNEIVVKGTHEGLVAGNKNELNTSFSKQITRTVAGTLEYTYRKPLIGPMPYVREGTADNPGPVLFAPRGPESPFWVMWESPLSGFDNREASIFSLTFTYDPTPDTWFYLYQPNTIEEWNLNPDENADISFATRYKLARYPGGTDALLFYDENGSVQWTSRDHTGAWATDGYLGSLTLMTKFLYPGWKFLWEFETGESLATNNYAYNGPNSKEKPITGYFITGISAKHGPYYGRLRYSKDAWGPEAWHQQFGETFDDLYQVSVGRKFGDYIDLGVEYIGARENDYQYVATELGDYDEFRFALSLSFGPIMPYYNAAKAPSEVQTVGESPEMDFTAPQVSLALSPTTYNPKGGVMIMKPWAIDYSGIASWKIEISDAGEKIVKTISGEGQPPYTVEWDGKDDLYEMALPEGSYKAVLTAVDEANNIATTEARSFTVSLPAPAPEQETPKPAVKESVSESSQETKALKVTETDRGLLVSLTSRVLFDYGRSEVKRDANAALKELVGIIKTYQTNQIAVEGHTDNVGSKSFNQRLSEKRAWSVANYLIKAGIPANRIKVIGYGKDKPVASNSTAAGREANRRVEVIILK